ncbi:MFS transporter [Paraburkholderia sp. D15]|uniref:MFS transporter n=1 Tax=Paraburkholderia sp. D15 TaxID=2880218 RepID=UPI00247A4292|nr:MFS transporter [Paraburkholderia sp. D15]WGS54224.1 MFS transporter [Paraburkholderia sp. D15]WKF60233.1 Multidrug resistance protein Stp [Paraburkholderia busanensis]
MADLAIHRGAASRVLAATCISYTVVLLDASIVNVALAEIGHTLGSSVAGLQWIVNAYTLTFASLLMTGGTLGDRFGARNVYLTGLTVFVLGSVLCGCAPNLATLSLARALQGIGSALLVPCSLALINDAYPHPTRRAAAVSLWMGCGGVAMASGPLIGGLLIHSFGWRSIFFVNVPIGLAGVWLAQAVERTPVERTASSRTRHVDLPGQLAVAVALASLIGVLIEGHRLGWQSAPIVAGMTISVAAWTTFFVVEFRTRHPMLPMQFFRNALFSASTLVSMISAFVFYGMLFTFSLFYQQARDYSALDTGLAFLPMTAMVALGGLLSSRVVKRLGVRESMCVAFALYALGALGMSFATANSPYWLAVAPMLAIGMASGFISPAATSPALGTVDRQRVGIAAAVLNSARQSGSALGVAVFGTFISTAHVFQAAMNLILGIVVTLSMFAAGVWWMAARAHGSR